MRRPSCIQALSRPGLAAGVEPSGGPGLACQGQDATLLYLRGINSKDRRARWWELTPSKTTHQLGGEAISKQIDSKLVTPETKKMKYSGTRISSSVQATSSRRYRANFHQILDAGLEAIKTTPPRQATMDPLPTISSTPLTSLTGVRVLLLFLPRIPSLCHVPGAFLTFLPTQWLKPRFAHCDLTVRRVNSDRSLPIVMLWSVAKVRQAQEASSRFQSHLQLSD